MAIETRSRRKAKFADKEALLRVLDALDERAGFVPDPTMTVEKVREMMLADGVRPEENEFSRELIRLRDEE